MFLTAGQPCPFWEGERHTRQAPRGGEMGSAILNQQRFAEMSVDAGTGVGIGESWGNAGFELFLKPSMTHWTEGTYPSACPLGWLVACTQLVTSDPVVAAESSASLTQRHHAREGHSVSRRSESPSLRWWRCAIPDGRAPGQAILGPRSVTKLHQALTLRPTSSSPKSLAQSLSRRLEVPGYGLTASYWRSEYSSVVHPLSKRSP